MTTHPPPTPLLQNSHDTHPPSHRGFPLPLPPLPGDDAAPLVGAAPTHDALACPPAPDLVPMPTYQRTLTPDDLALFVRTHPDFRTSPLQAVNLASPYLLATTVLNPFTIMDTILPNVATYPEGSIWDLSTPSLPTWVTQLNQVPTNQIQAWMRRLARDPWRGLHATTQRPFTSSPPHSAYIPLTTGQEVTILPPPFWVWLDHGLLTGTYMVAVTTFCPAHGTTTATPTAPHPHSDYNNDDCTTPAAGPQPLQCDCLNDGTPHNTPGSLALATAGSTSHSTPSSSNDYQPTPHALGTLHPTAPPLHDADQSEMALLGLVPLSVFMP